MSSIKIKWQTASSTLSGYDFCQKELSSAIATVQSVKSNHCMTGKYFAAIYQSLDKVISDMNDEKTVIGNLKNGLGDVLNSYNTYERRIDGQIKGEMLKETNTGSGVQPTSAKSTWDKFLEEFRDNYGWSDLLKGSGYIGKIYNFVNDIKSGKSWNDFTKKGLEMYQFMEGAAKTFSNYKKIGNAVGTKKAMTWWMKSITGLKPLGRASTAKNPFTRFVNNLTNKTSPFHAQLTDIVDNFKGANGVKKAVSSWGAVAATGVLNWFSNKDEQASSGGEMSDGRVLAETISETVIDTALTYGSSIIVGAAVTTVLGTVAAPGVLVVATSGLIMTGINAGVKALTGKTTTEWLSDTILDTGEKIGKAVGSFAKKITNPIGNWFNKLSFA